MHYQHVMEASQWIKAALVAAVNVQPFASGLTEAELREIVVGRENIGPGTFNDALQVYFGGNPSSLDEEGRLVASSVHIVEIMINAVPIPDEIRPSAALNALASAFDGVQNELGQQASVERSVLHARCHPVAATDIDRALGLMLACGSLSREDDRFSRRRPWAKFNRSSERPQLHRDVAACAVALLPSVRDAFARRRGQHAPREKPVDRFGRFLLSQGWTGFSGWWTSTAQEMRSLTTESHPTAIAVLCGAMLEAALVAVSKPARDAKMWNRDFLKEPPDRWKAGHLIDQAHVAKVFTDAQRSLAATLSDARNRIHAGRFHAGDTFNPPYTNAHDARLAREHLDLLLVALLDWPPIATLCTA